MTAEIYKQCCDPGVTWEGTTHGKVSKLCILVSNWYQMAAFKT